MKFEQVQTAFEPVTITLESREELIKLRSLISNGKTHMIPRGDAWTLGHLLESKLNGAVK